MAEDPEGRVACETLVNTGLVVVSGEITTEAYVDIPKIVRETIRKIGYSGGRYGFDCDSCAVITAIDEQSPESRRAWTRPTRLALTPRTMTSSTWPVPGPGHDVRLRLARDQGAHAAPDLARAQAGPPSRRGAPRRADPVPGSGRKDPGDHSLRERPPDRDRARAHLHSAQGRRGRGDADQAGPLGARVIPSFRPSSTTRRSCSTRRSATSW